MNACLKKPCDQANFNQKGNQMKNGYTPRQYAHSLAIDALKDALKNRFGELNGLAPAEEIKTKHQFQLLIESLADEAMLDIS